MAAAAGAIADTDSRKKSSSHNHLLVQPPIPFFNWMAPSLNITRPRNARDALQTGWKLTGPYRRRQAAVVLSGEVSRGQRRGRELGEKGDKELLV